MRRTLRSAGYAAVCVLFASASTAAWAYAGEELATGAQVSIDQARASR